MKIIVTIVIMTGTLLQPAGTYADTLYSEQQVPGATLKISFRHAVNETQAKHLVEWVKATATTISTVYGRFPYPSPNIIIDNAQRMSWGSDAAVTFGQVTRRNGGTVELYVNADRPIEEFYEDWTATHELSHLMLPLLERRNRWISEGLATYYQNILMARSGHYSPEQAWLRLLEGFERGRQSEPELSPNNAAANSRRQARMKIYWSGAALALMADIQLRQRSGGEESLDTVLGELQQCCLPTRRTWSGKRLFRRLDSFLDDPVFMRLYDRYANTPGFPEPADLLQRLGVSMSDGRVHLDSSAELAGLRSLLTSAPEAKR